MQTLIDKKAEYVENFLKKYEFPCDCVDCFVKGLKKIDLDENAKKWYIKIVKEYENDRSFNVTTEDVDKIALKIRENGYVLALAVLISLTKELENLYSEENLPKEFYDSAVLDLKYKAEECKLVKGVFGTFKFDWFKGWFTLDRFAIGRLQFELKKLGVNYERNGKKFSPDTPVIKVHIPRSGERLSYEKVEDAYKRASEFFKNRYNLKEIIFVCHTWFFYHKTKEFVKEKSNLFAFMKDYEIINENETDISEMWRLFDTEIVDLKSLPEDSSLRKAYKEYLIGGGKVGEGLGVFVYKC